MTYIKERALILTAQEVNAVLAGDKAQHRVIIKNTVETQILFNGDWRYDGRDFLDNDDCIPHPKGAHYMERLDLSEDEEHQYTEDYRCVGHCPLGVIGDRLWVQEEHRPVNWSFDDGEVTIEYRDGTTKTPHYLTDEEFDNNPNDDYPFAVVDELLARNIPIIAGKDCFDFNNPNNLPHWRSADVMPRFASRLLLEITDIRIERMNDIGEDDAIAEGIKLIHSNPADRVGPNHFTKSNGWYHCSRPTAAEVFKEMYKVSDDYDRYGENPWVWVVEFKVIEPSED